MTEIEKNDDLQHYLDQRSVEAVEANPELAESWAKVPEFVIPTEAMPPISAVEETDG